MEDKESQVIKMSILYKLRLIFSQERKNTQLMKLLS